MATYSLNPAALRADAAQLEAQSKKLVNSVEALRPAVQQYRRENAGETADSYVQAQEKSDIAAKDLAGVVANGGVALERIIDGYIHGDRQGSSLF